MRTHEKQSLLFLLALAASSLAAAAEPPSGAEAVAELTQPRSEVEIGEGGLTQGSYKFGEDNGLQTKGPYSIFNFDLFGGGTYDSNSVERWDVHGTDLGLDTREISADFREQGKFRADFDYDQLRHNISDSYQTPFLNAGTNFLQLPATWLKPIVPQVNGNLNDRSLSPVTGLANAVAPNGTVVPPTAAQIATVNAILAADVPDFRSYNLSTNRYRWGAGFSVNLTRDWQFAASIREERKDGTQPIGAIISEVQENSVTLPLLLDSITDQYNAGFKYASSAGFVDVGYYGSIYHNDVGSLSWNDPADHTRSGRMATSPSNQFHQLNFSGGYSLARSTNLSFSGSYGRSTQDEAFLNDPTLPLGLPATSADARVVSTLLDFKLTSRPMKRLSVAAGYKYDDEDNRTPVERFIFYDVNIPPGAAASAFNAALGLPAGTLSSNVNIFNNRPHSRRVNQADLDADYSLAPGQNVAVGYRWEGIERACHQSWIDCESADKTNESTAKAEWRANWLETLSSRIAYAYANRSVGYYNSNAWLALVPMANVVPAVPGVTTSVYGYLTQTGLTGFGPIAGFPATPLTGDAAIYSPNNNIVPQSLYGSRDNVSEMPGMRRFNVADRHQQRLRSSLDWQPSERFTFDAAAEFNRDDYEHTQFGLLDDESWAVHLEGAFTPKEDVEFPVFYSHEELKSSQAGDGFGSNTNAAFVGKAGNTVVAGSCFTTVLAKNLNGKIDPCLDWFTQMHERADTFGLSASRKDLKGGRLNLSGDVIFSLARTHIDVQGGSYANNPFALAGAPALPPGTPAVFLIPANDLPPVTTRLFELRFRAQYSLSKASQLNFLAAYQWFRSSDFAYQGMQFGSGTEQMPTLEQPFNYSVGLFALSYVHRF